MAQESDAGGLRSVPDLTKALLDAVAPFARWEHPQGRLALSVLATGPRVPQARWSASDGAARVEIQSSADGPPSALVLHPGRLAVDEGFVTLRTRFRVEGAAGTAAYVAELLDGIFGFVRRAREPAPETRLDGGLVVWERPVSRCEVLLVVERSLGRPLAGEIRFRFADDRIVLELSDQEDPRWDTAGGLGVFDPWPFAVWLARRHVKLLRPALRVAIELERPSKPAAPARRASRTRAAKRPARKKGPGRARG